MEIKKPGTSITLDYPITVNGAEIKEVFLRRATVADHRAMAKGAGTNIDQEVMLFANLLNMAPSDVDLLDAKDYQKITEAYKGFLS